MEVEAVASLFFFYQEMRCSLLREDERKVF